MSNLREVLALAKRRRAGEDLKLLIEAVDEYLADEDEAAEAEFLSREDDAEPNESFDEGSAEPDLSVSAPDFPANDGFDDDPVGELEPDVSGWPAPAADQGADVEPEAPAEEE